jgi:hypothetical protein
MGTHRLDPMNIEPAVHPGQTLDTPAWLEHITEAEYTGS